MSDYFSKFSKALNEELKKADTGYKNAKKSALEIAASAAASPSQAGDRFHSQGAADLAKERYDVILALKNEIELKGENVFKKFEGKEIILVDNPIVLNGFLIVSTKSPLGQRILNEK